MREIRFRAKDTITGEWVYSNGYYFDGYNYWFILPTDKPNVDKALAWTRHIIVEPETIGQFTGLCDKCKKKIYEGDRIRIWNGNKGYISYSDGYFRIGNKRRIIDCYEWEDFEVIGNIHENPELLK